MKRLLILKIACSIFSLLLIWSVCSYFLDLNYRVDLVKYHVQNILIYSILTVATVITFLLLRMRNRQ